MTPEQEKKWDQEFIDLCMELEISPYNHYYREIYFSPRKAAQVEIAEMVEKLKAREELIKKSIPYIEYAIKYSTPLSQNKAEELVKNIKTLLGE